MNVSGAPTRAHFRGDSNPGFAVESYLILSEETHSNVANDETGDREYPAAAADS